MQEELYWLFTYILKKNKLRRKEHNNIGYSSKLKKRIKEKGFATHKQEMLLKKYQLIIAKHNVENRLYTKANINKRRQLTRQLRTYMEHQSNNVIISITVNRRFSKEDPTLHDIRIKMDATDGGTKQWYSLLASHAKRLKQLGWTPCGNNSFVDDQSATYNEADMKSFVINYEVDKILLGG